MASLRANAVRGHSERQPVSAAHSASMPGRLCSRDALVHVHNTCCSSWRDGGPIQGETEASTRQLMRMTMHFQWRKCSTMTQLQVTVNGCLSYIRGSLCFWTASFVLSGCSSAC